MQSRQRRNLKTVHGDRQSVARHFVRRNKVSVGSLTYFLITYKEGGLNVDGIDKDRDKLSKLGRSQYITGTYLTDPKMLRVYVELGGI